MHRPSILAFLFMPAILFNARAEPTASAPVLLWSPDRSLSQLPEVDGIDAIGSQALFKKYLNPLVKDGSESAVIFLQHKLDVDDFTKFGEVYSLDSNGGAFKNIKGFMEKHFSLELPQVEDPLTGVEALKANFDGLVHTVRSADELEGLDLGPNNGKFLLVVELSGHKKHAGEEEIIAGNDATVGAICHHLKKRGIKYSAMFTGNPAAVRKQDSVVDTHSGRHLLATAEANNGTFVNISGMFVYLRAVDVHLQTAKESVDLNLTVTESSMSKSSVSNDTALLVIDLSEQNGTSEYSVQITINATRMIDRWVVTRVGLTVDGPAGQGFNGTDTPLQTTDMDLVVPILYSYHCSSMKMYVDGVRNPSIKGTYVVLDGFQFQPFNVQGNAFFNAQDCVGFFTRGIWMGIFPSLILLGILIFGTLMVLNLSTPDKFDDPKGKTIVIAQAED